MLSKLKKMRVLNGLSQSQLAEMLGVSQSYLSLLERNQRDMTVELNTKIDDIFKDKNS